VGILDFLNSIEGDYELKAACHMPYELCNFYPSIRESMFAAAHPPFATTSYSARGSPAFSLALSLL
jgi:hypothetical protein